MPLGLILVLVLILVMLSGGGWYLGAGPAVYGGGLLGTVLVILLVVWLLRGAL